MNDKFEQAYFLGREVVARGLAETAASPTIKSIHLKMADAYAEKAIQIAGRPVPER